jgi:predicted nucleic acid-binding Zn ribbon protein
MDRRNDQLTVCRDCGEEFDPRGKIKRGYIDQCNQCSAGDVPKYLGRPGATAKGANIEIFRTNLKSVGAVINKERASGFSASLSFANGLELELTDREFKAPKRGKHRKKGGNLQ